MTANGINLEKNISDKEKNRAYADNKECGRGCDGTTEKTCETK
jgi:hypothetical protein